MAFKIVWRDGSKKRELTDESKKDALTDKAVGMANPPIFDVTNANNTIIWALMRIQLMIIRAILSGDNSQIENISTMTDLKNRIRTLIRNQL